VSNYTVEEKVEALVLLLRKALEAASEVEARIPYYMNAKTYASRLKRMIENALKISEEVRGELEASK